MAYPDYATEVRQAPDLSSPVTADSIPAVNWLHELADATHQLAAAGESYHRSRTAWQLADTRYRECLEQAQKERESASI